MACLLKAAPSTAEKLRLEPSTAGSVTFTVKVAWSVTFRLSVTVTVTVSWPSSAKQWETIGSFPWLVVVNVSSGLSSPQWTRTFHDVACGFDAPNDPRSKADTDPSGTLWTSAAGG